MVGRKKRQDEDSSSSSSDSDDEVLSTIKKKSVGKKNGGRSNNRLSSGKTKARAKKSSSEEEQSDSESDGKNSESEEEAKKSKSKDTNEKRKSDRSNKSAPVNSTSRQKRNVETSKESSKMRTEPDQDESSESSSQENDRSSADQNGKSESRTKGSVEKREGKQKKTPPKKEKEEEYEVEQILDFKVEDKTKQFLVRWKGYDSSSDSWVSRRDLHCTGLIVQFYEKNPTARHAIQKRRRRPDHFIPKKTKKIVQNTLRPLKIDEQPDYDSEAFDENQEWKVEKIIDVRYRRDKKRDFLIRWEGFSSKSDSWEPEENLDCKELIKKFTAKLDILVNASVKELRPVRKPTQRYTVMDVTKGRRLSKRFDGRQRTSYYDCEE